MKSSCIPCSFILLMSRSWFESLVGKGLIKQHKNIHCYFWRFRVIFGDSVIMDTLAADLNNFYRSRPVHLSAIIANKLSVSLCVPLYMSMCLLSSLISSSFFASWLSLWLYSMLALCFALSLALSFTPCFVLTLTSCLASV